jgi:threonine dehydrogenase-like Zn-dependent dehydrogenase
MRVIQAASEDRRKTMRHVAVAFSGPRTIGFMEEEARPLQDNEVRLRTLYSGISAGTELTAFRGTNPYLHRRWDDAMRLFVSDPDNESIRYPVKGWGYEEVGEVIEVGSGVEDIPLGNIIYGTWGHRTAHVMSAASARQRVLPEEVDPLLGIFSQIGAIAYNGILDAGIRLGETVAVFGLGVVGQLVAQLAKLSGAEVIGVDLVPMRLEVARQTGIDHVIDAAARSPAEQIKALTEGRGADVCIEASGAAPALNEAVRACAYSSKVVALGFFQGAAQGLYLGEEFHHNRINIVCSQIGGQAADLQHRWNGLRLARSFMRLAAQGRLQLHPLVTHVAPAAEAPALFKLVDEHPSEVLQAVLDFRDDLPPTLDVVRLRAEKKPAGRASARRASAPTPVRAS